MIEFMRSALTAHTNLNGSEAVKRPTQALARDDRDDAESLAMTQSVALNKEAAVLRNELDQSAAVQRLEATQSAQFEARRLNDDSAEVRSGSLPDASEPVTPTQLQDLHTLEPDAILGTRLNTRA